MSSGLRSIDAARLENKESAMKLRHILSVMIAMLLLTGATVMAQIS
jgi:hypothetical protein